MSLSHHIRRHVVGYVAVFLALAGSAHALAGRNTVDSGDIVASGVTAPDVGGDAVTGAKITDGTLGTTALADRGVRRVDLRTNSVDRAKVADGSLVLDDFEDDLLRSRFGETCGGQNWRFFRMAESAFNCGSPVVEVVNSFQTNLPGWELHNGCTATGNPILAIESTENAATVNWFYSDGSALHTGGTALAASEDVRFNQTPIFGQFILSTPGDSFTRANTITVTFEGTGCVAKATAAIGLL
jgi:hypothetical protein